MKPISTEPLEIALSLITPREEDEIPTWADTIEQQKQAPPAMSVDLLLSLGNRESDQAPHLVRSRQV